MIGVGEPFCIIMVESAEAVADLDATLAQDGVDGIYVGPSDLSYSLGCALDSHDPVLKPFLERIRFACAAAGKPVGIHASDGVMARRYRDDGCSLVTVAAAALAIARGAAGELATARDSRPSPGRRAGGVQALVALCPSSCRR
jgi:4-hydroxy-2-oxoheptanedioate aldolase